MDHTKHDFDKFQYWGTIRVEGASLFIIFLLLGNGLFLQTGVIAAAYIATGVRNPVFLYLLKVTQWMKFHCIFASLIGLIAGYLLYLYNDYQGAIWFLLVAVIIIYSITLDSYAKRLEKEIFDE